MAMSSISLSFMGAGKELGSEGEEMVFSARSSPSCSFLFSFSGGSSIAPDGCMVLITQVNELSRAGTKRGSCWNSMMSLYLADRRCGIVVAPKASTTRLSCSIWDRPSGEPLYSCQDLSRWRSIGPSFQRNLGGPSEVPDPRNPSGLIPRMPGSPCLYSGYWQRTCRWMPVRGMTWDDVSPTTTSVAPSRMSVS